MRVHQIIAKTVDLWCTVREVGNTHLKEPCTALPKPVVGLKPEFYDILINLVKVYLAYLSISDLANMLVQIHYLLD
jgi:hypothetical protein